MKNNKSQLSIQEQSELIKTLRTRFEKNIGRHKNIEWSAIQSRIESNTDKLWSLNEMEMTGGEPDVVGFDEKTNEYLFCDCSAESPKGRRSICYDHQALNARKEYKPADSAINMAAEMGIELLTEQQYKDLQQLGHFEDQV
ncbi:DUF4256 domain-containing protein [Emticicia fontis]